MTPKYRRHLRRSSFLPDLIVAVVMGVVFILLALEVYRP